MVQTVHSMVLSPGAMKKIIEKPSVLCRIFFSVQVFADQTAWYESRVSFDDPLFRSYYVLDGPARYFEAKGEGIFQGDVWIYNKSDVLLLYSATEILI